MKIIERFNARQEKNWARSDEVRDFLYEQGIVLRDTPNKTIWEYK